MATYKYFENDDEWLMFRAKYFSSSESHRLMTEPKNKSELLSVGAKTYITECVSEILAPIPPQFYNSDMEHGNEVEPRVASRIAKELGKSETDDDFIYTSIGGRIFFYDDEFDLGGTPDVIILNDMVCEAKCPKSKTHTKYLTIRTLDDFFKASKDESPSSKDSLKKYYGQMQQNMFLTDTEKCLFVSFDDRFYNPDHHYHSLIIPRDEVYITKLKEKALRAKEYKQTIFEILKCKAQSNKNLATA